MVVIKEREAPIYPLQNRIGLDSQNKKNMSGFKQMSFPLGGDFSMGCWCWVALGWGGSSKNKETNGGLTSGLSHYMYRDWNKLAKFV